MWAAVRIDPTGRALEADRAPLAVTLVVDVSSSMDGSPLAHALASCEVVASLLDARDQLAIVVFSTHASVVCGLTDVDATGRAQLAKSLLGVSAHGNTNMHGGLGVGAGVLATARPGLRRVLVLMSDGRPNIGLATADTLAGYTRSLGLAVSTLGFGLQHDEAVLDAIATAGSGRYAYVPDPMLARVDVARAALAHGGVVAAQLKVEIALGDGVELVRVLPACELRHSRAGVTFSVGDVFVDEGRVLAIELRLDLGAKLARGHLADITVSGVGPDGAPHRTTVALDVDVHGGPHAADRDAVRDVALVQADTARAQAREMAQKGRTAAAAASAAVILRRAIARIDAIEGFVRDDKSLLAELREQLEDEAANYESNAGDDERVHQDKASRVYKATQTATGFAPPPPGPAAFLLGAGGPLAGRRFRVLADMSIGRGASNEIPVPSGSLSRRHARVVYANGRFVLQDLGSTNGSVVNGVKVRTHVLADGDRVAFGEQVLIFSLDK